MLGHASFGVADLERATRFYDAVLGALGYVRVWDGGARGVGYGSPGQGDKLALFPSPAPRAPGAGFHLAFEASSRAAVDAFHAAALASGGADRGAPGPRPHYGPSYYAAFVSDPDGYRIEAVHQSPGSPE